MLTDARYFQGSFNFLREIREAGVSCPLLCKEFIVEAYQLYKARACAGNTLMLSAVYRLLCLQACALASHGLTWTFSEPGMVLTRCC